MARYKGPRIKVSRRFGQDLGLTQNPQKVARRIQVPPGQHGRRGRRRVSEYGRQLQEKQKIRFAYGVFERQLRRYMERAQRNPTATGTEFLRLLERRLDNVVYRLGFTPTRGMARQLVTHGHVIVNNKTITVPSYGTSVGDVIRLRDKSYGIPDVKQTMGRAEYQVPVWMQKEGGAGTIRRMPEREDIDLGIDEHLVVEYYSR